jgi:hypothetical protein
MAGRMDDTWTSDRCMSLGVPDIPHTTLGIMRGKLPEMASNSPVCVFPGRGGSDASAQQHIRGHTRPGREERYTCATLLRAVGRRLAAAGPAPAGNLVRLVEHMPDLGAQTPSMWQIGARKAEDQLLQPGTRRQSNQECPGRTSSRWTEMWNGFHLVAFISLIWKQALPALSAAPHNTAAHLFEQAGRLRAMGSSQWCLGRSPSIPPILTLRRGTIDRSDAS